jgi:hypothetical protein
MKTYFLFGEDVCRTFFETDNWDAVLEDIENGTEFDTYEFDNDNPQPADLLYRYHGWGDYAVITKEQYESIFEV